MSGCETLPFSISPNSTLLTAKHSHSHRLSASLIACIVVAVLALVIVSATAVIFVLLKRRRTPSFRYNPPPATAELLGTEELGKPRQELPDNLRAELSCRESHIGMGVRGPDLSSRSPYGYDRKLAINTINEVGQDMVMPRTTNYDALDYTQPVELSSSDVESRRVELDARPVSPYPERTSNVSPSTQGGNKGLNSDMRGPNFPHSNFIPVSASDVDRRLSYAHLPLSSLRTDMPSPVSISDSHQIGCTTSSINTAITVSPVSASPTLMNQDRPWDTFGKDFTSRNQDLRAYGYNSPPLDLDGRILGRLSNSASLLHRETNPQSVSVVPVPQSHSIDFAQSPVTQLYSPQPDLQTYELTSPFPSVAPQHTHDIPGLDQFIEGDKRHAIGINTSLLNTLPPSVVRSELFNQPHFDYTENHSLDSSPSSVESWGNLSERSCLANPPTTMSTPTSSPTSPTFYSSSPDFGFR